MTEKLIIVGAGHAAGQLAVSLRQGKYQGAITLFGDESIAPYQRPPLSKKYLSGELDRERLLVKPAAFYADNDIDLRLGSRVATVDRDTHTLALDDGEQHTWDKLVFATGSRARQLPIEGAQLAGVHYLRSAADVDSIRRDFEPGKRLTIIGGGYIGLEVAAVAIKAGMHVDVIEREERLLSRVVASEISAFYHQVHGAAGVIIHLRQQVTAIEGQTHVASLRLSDDTILESDLVIIGIGVNANTELASQCGLACDNGILVDEFCQTEDPDVLAIGDCTNHPNALLGRRLRLESVPNALEQARTAAATLLGTPRAYNQVPWFWSDQYDLKLQIVGLTSGYDQTVLRGTMADQKFACFYLREGRLIAVDAVNSPREFMLAKPAVAAGARIPVEVLADAQGELKDAASRWPG